MGTPQNYISFGVLRRKRWLSISRKNQLTTGYSNKNITICINRPEVQKDKRGWSGLEWTSFRSEGGWRVIELAPYIGVILKLFLDIVPSSSVDVTRALRGCFRGGFLYVSFCFKAKEDLQRCDVFSYILISKQQRSFLRPSLCFNTFRNFNRSLNKRQMSPEQTITTE